MLPQPTLQKEKSPTDVGVIHKWTARALLKAVKIALNTILQRQHERARPGHFGYRFGSVRVFQVSGSSDRG